LEKVFKKKMINIYSLETIKNIGREIALYRPISNSQRYAHTSLAEFKWLFGGNQSGKTHTNMLDLALLALDFHPRKCLMGTHWACIESWEQVRDILWEDNLKKFIPPHKIYNIVYGQERVPRKVFLKNGHKIEFKAFNQGRNLFQGRAVDSIHCDEQCLHDFVGIFNEMQARLLKKNGFMSWSMTPVVPQPELEERIEDLPDTDGVFQFDLNDNRKSRGGYINDSKIDKMISEWPEETRATRIRGEFASFFGAVFKTYSRKTHVIPPFRIPSHWRKYRSFDFGFTNPFVCLWLAQDSDDNWYVYREYYKAKTGINEHIKHVKLYSMKENYLASYADPENAGDREAMRKVGIKTIAAQKDIARGIEMVQSKFMVKENGKPSLFIFKTCRNTAREIASYHYPKGSSSKNPRDIPEQKNDHTVDALRYCIYTKERPKKKGSVYIAA
jgi:hypothetical protein